MEIIGFIRSERCPQLNDRFRQFQPAYRYGYRLARDMRYADRSWSEIEPQARRHWEADEDTPWDEVRDAVRYGWERVRQAAS